jgi:hypothetical protein
MALSRSVAFVVALAVPLLASIGGCGGGASDSGDSGGGGVSFSADIQPLFNAYCTVCHTPGGSASFLPLTVNLAHGALVNQNSTMTVGGGLRVAPGDSAASVLWKRVSGAGLDPSEATMPPGFTVPPDEQALIRAWIDEGAANN